MNPKFLYLLFFITSFSFAQTIKLEGIVLENGKTPLEMANVCSGKSNHQSNGRLLYYQR
jgi:hypothetical protein